MAATRHYAVKLKKSPAGRKPEQRRTVEGLGLKRFGKTVYLKDTPAIRGMIYKVIHLVDVETRDGEAPLSNRGRARANSKS